MQSKIGIEAIALREADNVATALRIPFGHKLALIDIPQGANIVKYGEVMGRATQVIPAGTHAHIHNIESLRGRGDLEGKGASHGV